MCHTARWNAGSNASSNSKDGEKEAGGTGSLTSLLEGIMEVKKSASAQQENSFKQLEQLFKDNDKDHFLIPMGGAEEIGMNCNLYVHKNRFLMVDLGVNLTNIGNGSTAIMPDLDYVMRNKHKLVALVITHAHEDHIGAVATLWPDLKCPLYCTKFTAEMIRARLPPNVRIPPLHIIDQKTKVTTKPFSFTLQHMTHSIPESHAVILHTEQGHIVHTGDWKHDSAPLLGPPFDYAAMNKLGEEGVLAVVGDSTNAVVEGESVPESEVQRGLRERLLKVEPDRQCVLTCFSSSVSRVGIALDCAPQMNRRPALMGHAMLTTSGIAHDCGYLPTLPSTRGLHEVVTKHAPAQCLMLATGCQGEPAAALSRMASGDHPIVHLGPDDVVIFSSRVIPGNELDVQRVVNQLKRRGVRIIRDGEDGVPTHASGHAYRGDIRMLLSRLRPQMVVPVHGEYLHLEEHCSLAREQGVKHTIIPRNGNVIHLHPHEGPKVVGQVNAGQLVMDGRLLRRMDSPIMQDRMTQQAQGACFITVVLSADNQLLVPPVLSHRGLIDKTETQLQQQFVALSDMLGEELSGLNSPPDSVIQGVAQAAVMGFCQRRLGKRPVCEVHIVRQSM
ncbi:metallo-beta-lactamase superfamily [Salpingoeca rosetta]|uniref:Metallo-beta-lactamase superfamily n=1 Tax=Salpingoeca rosetta (strain ATCC 50818 / BSB-021) TaxID=946362 RepID=F2TX70_SALR5|nr:metallo-beta-lactamase superfamily [Salpingoeca rosetta]EGD75979.1 metallo-beta-lactamase superfamily [Salpingoeca rosetta]|eukprot:XP_004998154.1 metallo-beta-lactamase superfamily [Salpingoeca rosetta]